MRQSRGPEPGRRESGSSVAGGCQQGSALPPAAPPSSHKPACAGDLGTFGPREAPAVCQPVPRWERICNSTLCSFPEPCDLAGLLAVKGSRRLWAPCPHPHCLPAPPKGEISRVGTLLSGAGRGGGQRPAGCVMEDQDCGGASWESAQDRGPRDSPWSWVRARAWPFVHCGPGWERCGAARWSVPRGAHLRSGTFLQMSGDGGCVCGRDFRTHSRIKGFFSLPWMEND